MNLANESWMLIPGVLLLSSFLPLTVCSYRWYRLPKKQDEYKRVMKKLKDAGMEDTFTQTLLENEYSSKDYILPLTFVTIFSILGFWVLFMNNADILLSGLELVKGSNVNAYKIRSLIAIGMAFLGCYLWSVQYIFRRLITIDLPPGAYYSVGIRMIVGSFVALTFHNFVAALPSGEISATVDVVPDGTLIDMLPVVAFLTGLFPQRVLKYITEYFKFTATKPDRRADELPLDMIEGMTSFHKARLSEAGIDNVQNLAHASLVELIVNTPYRPRQLVDWMAQARLCLSFKFEVQKLRKAGIRTMLGFKIAGDKGTLEDIAKSTGIDEVYLNSVYHIYKDNPAIDRLAKAENCLHVV